MKDTQTPVLENKHKSIFDPYLTDAWARTLIMLADRVPAHKGSAVGMPL